MFYVRTTKTSSLKTAVQVVRYVNRQTVVLKHLGSAANTKEIKQLKLLAEKWVERASKQRRLFKDKKRAKEDQLTPMSKYQYLGVRYFFAYEVLKKVFTQIGFQKMNSLLLDLVLMRLLEPGSKLKSVRLLKEYFGISYSRSSVYRALPSFINLKEKAEQTAISYAKKHLAFDFKMVFYDVTTLYFETDKTDELRKPGFSKDYRFNQPQILLGLVVNNDGFPLYYDIFEGKTFEGHTLLPLITGFKRKHQIDTLTIVADAAMLSVDNIAKILDQELSYIVGARIASLPLAAIKQVSLDLKQQAEASLRLNTKHGLLICDFSQERYRKDKYEMEKQIKKAKGIIQQKAKKDKKKPRAKFIKTIGKTKYTLNQKLIAKTKLILGIKGYYTNLSKINNQEIITQYHNLWKVEKAFRISKTDLKTRPVFHFKKQTIEVHILICFMALCVAKHLEIKTDKSLQASIKLLKGVTDARMLNTITKKETTARSPMSVETKQMLKTLGLSY